MMVDESMPGTACRQPACRQQVNAIRVEIDDEYVPGVLPVFCRL